MEPTRAEATVSGVVSAIGKKLPDGSRYVKLDNSALTKDVIVAAMLVTFAIAINVELYEPVQNWMAGLEEEV